MANPIIKIKRSAIAGKVPTISDLELGELAINTYDGKVYLEQDQGGVGVGTTVVVINPWSVGTGTNTYDTHFTSGSVGIGTTNPTSKLDVSGDIKVSGIITATGGFNIGIQSGGIDIASGVVTAINFNGAGHTVSYDAETKTVNITISGGLNAYSIIGL